MNCFAHAFPFLDDAYYAVGSCVPDWLAAADRRVRVREHRAAEFVQDMDPIVSAIARGVVQHHRDDHRFHQSRAFNELSLQFAVELKELFNEPGMRPGLIGHIIVEVFLDAYIHLQNPGQLDYFYQQVRTVDPLKVQETINRFSNRATDKLAAAMDRFLTERYIFDYVSDERTVYRLNRVLSMIGLEPIESRILQWTPSARSRVYERAKELLVRDNGPTISPSNGRF